MQTKPTGLPINGFYMDAQLGQQWRVMGTHFYYTFLCRHGTSGPTTWHSHFSPPGRDLDHWRYSTWPTQGGDPMLTPRQNSGAVIWI